MLTRDERLVPGYFRDPDWSVKDLVAHLGAWLTEAATQLTNIAARSYVPHDLDVDARNAETLAAMRDEPWEAVWAQASEGRAYMLEHWFALRLPSDAANQWCQRLSPETAAPAPAVGFGGRVAPAKRERAGRARAGGVTYRVFSRAGLSCGRRGMQRGDAHAPIGPSAP